MLSCDWPTVCLHNKPVISDPRSWYVQLHAEIRWPVNFKTNARQIIYLSSNQRRTHTVRFLCCFAVTIANNIEACAYFIVCHFFVVTVVTSELQKWRVSWFNDFIGRFSQQTKPRPQKLANVIDRLTPALWNSERAKNGARWAITGQMRPCNICTVWMTLRLSWIHCQQKRDQRT